MKVWFACLVLLSANVASAERALVLPWRTEVELSAERVAELVLARDEVLRAHGVEPIALAGSDACPDQACIAAKLREASAQHAVEIALWRSVEGQISGVSVSLVLESGERFSQGVQAEKVGAAQALTTAARGAYERLRRGPGPWLELEGTPAGAMIAVDGQPVGILPQRVKVPGGLLRVRVSHEGFESFEEAVTVPRNVDAIKHLSLALRPAAKKVGSTRDKNVEAPQSAWNYAIGGIAIAASAVLALGPLQSAAQDGECGRDEGSVCTGVVDFDAGEGIQLAAAALLLGTGATIAIWAPL